MKIGIVGCGSEKLDRPAPARELYTGQLFRKSLAYAEQRCERVWIVSAKGGLLRLDQEVAPYDEKLSESKKLRWSWGRLVWEQLRAQHFADSPHDLMILAGVTYAEPIAAFARGDTWRVELPLEGMEIGERLRFLTNALKEAT